MKVGSLLLTALFLSASLFTIFDDLQAEPGLIGYWNFDEGSGSTIFDQTANANHGIIVDDYSATISGVFVPGIRGTALYLDGHTEVQFGVPDNLSPANAITLEAWYNGVDFAGTGNDPIIDRGYLIHAMPAYQYHLGVCGTNYLFPGNSGFLFANAANGDYNVVGTYAAQAWTPGNWYHVVGTWDGTRQRLYLNGVMIRDEPLTGTIPDYLQPMKFGGFDNLPNKLYGTIDEIRIYDRALSPDEVLQHYNQPNNVDFIIRIEKTHGTFQGGYVNVPIIKSFGNLPMGGFDFLVAYDASALSFASAALGTSLGPTGCGWEYFTYRYGAQGNCGGSCPSGLLRAVAIADANNGANHPSCFTVPDGSELVVLKFYVTNDRNFECQYVPVRFVWLDCGDNGISSVSGETLFISKKVFEFETTDSTPNPDYEITGLDCDLPLHYGGACAECDSSLKYEPLRNLIFWNGGVDIVCSDSIDAPGDLNLNDIAFEIADAVLYTNYFLYGLSALDPNPTYLQAQIAASDANRDGITLSVGDLVYMLRVVVGDALPYPKLTPFANSATVSFTDGILTTDAPVDIGGVYATFRVSDACNVVNTSNMTVLSESSDGMMKVLVYSGREDLMNSLAAGHNNLFTIDGSAELVGVEVADAAGNMLNTRFGKGALPTEFKLAQNTPNPFNPTTRIGFDLPVPSDWTLEIFNVAGQLVKTFNGRGVGNISVEWDATDQPSGVYFYKATAGSQSDSRKMLLLK